MFAGLNTLIKLILRRDRVKLPVWTLGFVVSLLWMIPLLQNMYGDSASLNTLYQTFAANPAGIFLTGMMDAPTFGSLFTIETVLWWGMAIAFLNILLVVRHTRQNEEMGAQELIQSCRVGRHASLAAVLIVALAVNLLIVVCLGVGMPLLTNAWSVEQSWLYAISTGLFGMVWAAITAVVVQLVEATRTATGTMTALVGATFMLRGVGDFMGSVGANGLIRPEWFSYLSPFGWTQATRALTFPDWWPLLVPAVFIVVVIPLAFWLLGLRDLGEGLLPSRAGRARATASLRTPLGFTWYIQRNVFIGWFVGVISLIATIGALVPEMSKVFNSTDTVRMLIESIGGTGALVPAFLSTMLALGVIAITGYVIQGMGKLRAEESSGHTENLLATRLSRYRWLGLHVGMVLLLALVMLVLSGAVMALMTNFGSDYNVDVFDYILAAVSYFPIMLAFAGLYVLLFGLVPRLAGTIVWTYFGFMAFSTWIGPMVGFPEWLMNLSVIKHFASAPASDIQIMPVVVVSVVGVALLTAGTIAWRQRNLVE